MPTTQHATTNATVLDAVRRLVADDDRRSDARRAASVMRRVAAQKAAAAAEGREADPYDNWALLVSAIDRGGL